jgi:hypothetical protein
VVVTVAAGAETSLCPPGREDEDVADHPFMAHLQTVKTGQMAEEIEAEAVVVDLREAVVARAKWNSSREMLHRGFRSYCV